MCIVKKEMFRMINIVIDFYKILETTIENSNRGDKDTIARMVFDE